jgi:gas vesicle protein
MGIAEGMKSITDNITASYEARAKAIEELVSDVQETLNSFADDRKKMSKKMKKDLAKYVKGIATEVKNLIGDFAEERRQIAADLQGMADHWQNMVATLAEKKGVKKNY